MANVTVAGASYSNVPAIELPSTGGGVSTFYEVDGSQTVTRNGTYDVTSLAQVVVNVGGGSAVVVTEEPDTGGGVIKNITAVDLSMDTVDAAHLLQGYTAHDSTGTAITGTYVPSTQQTQTKTATPTESVQSITPDSGYLLSEVTVGAIDSEYVGSDITRRSGADLTASGATVSVPSGYYSAAASKSVASGSASTPSTSITANPTISVSISGLITASVSATESITPSVSAGYVSSGTAGNVSVSGSKTQQLTTKTATTITPTKSSQTAVASGVYTTGAITVAAIPSNYIDTSDATATASQINSGATAYVNGSLVTGTQVIQTYYTGSSNPSASLGSDGDLYLKVVS